LLVTALPKTRRLEFGIWSLELNILTFESFNLKNPKFYARPTERRSGRLRSRWRRLGFLSTSHLRPLTSNIYI